MKTDSFASSRFGSSRAQITVERLLALVVVAGLIYVAQQYLASGALPRPFNSDPSQSLMDFYNTAYWANRGAAAYEVWHTVYPPLPLIFAQIVTSEACYAGTAMAARSCDPAAVGAIVAFYVLNIVLVFLSFRRSNPASAVPRTLALCLGLPMLYGLELANLIIPCFTFFVLAEGRLLKSSWLRNLCRAVAFNFKLYLLVTTLPFALQRNYLRLIVAGASVLAVYLITLVIYGSGTPWALFNDLLFYASFQSATYLEENHLPAIAAASHDVWRLSVPILLRFGECVAVVGLAAGLFSRGEASRRRLAALALSILCAEAALHTEGYTADYTQIFLIFLLFLERGGNRRQILLVALAYILCISADFALVYADSTVRVGYFSGAVVQVDFSLGLSQFVRPLIVVLIQICLTTLVLPASVKKLRILRRKNRRRELSANLFPIRSLVLTATAATSTRPCNTTINTNP